MSRLFPVFFFLVLHSIARLSLWPQAPLLNEDAALILEGIESFASKGIFHWFYHGYGPSIIRPWQLIWFGAIGHLTHSPQGFLIAQIALLSVAQWMLFLTLRPGLGYPGAFLAALLPGLSRGGAESTLWLSCQHDLFLLLFVSASLFFAIHSFQSTCSIKSVLCTLAAYLFMICAFYSNEKAVVLPFGCLSLLFIWGREKYQSFWRQFLLLGTGYMVIIGFYFGLRHVVLGKFVGGYTNQLFGNEFFNLKTIANWSASTITSLLWQPREFAVLTLIGCAILASFTLLFVTYERNFSRISTVCFIVITHLVCTLPTAQFALSPF
ncbi:MAG: hypothetical protein KDD60_07605, partial [Bdellovibrionales bacterium]|nr:hypothetical protein [Bdellovibrionales bacterium]